MNLFNKNNTMKKGEELDVLHLSKLFKTKNSHIFKPS